MAKDYEKKSAKLEAKKAKADAKKAELLSEYKELKVKIAEESDEKTKKKLRAQRDEVLRQREAIASSKDGMTIPMSTKAKKGITSAVAIVLIVALLVCYLATGTAKHGLMSYFGVPQSSITAFTMVDGDGNKHSIKVSTYNYYFAMFYNQIQQTKAQYEQYGFDEEALEKQHLNVDFDEKFSKQTTKNDDDETVTWAKYMKEEVTENIKSTYLYYYEAVKANKGKEPKITDEQKKEIDEAIGNYKDSAKQYGYTTSAYLTAAMGKGVNEKVFRREAKIAYIAQNYQEKYADKLMEKEYTDKEYDKYKKDNYDDLVSVDVKYFECDTEDDAKAFKKALNADGSNFADLASKYASTDFDKKANKNAVETTYVGMTRSTLKSVGAAIATADEKKDEKDEDKFSGLDWLFSKDRKAGDVKQSSTSVVYVVKPVYLSKQHTVSVRHILIAPEEEAKEGEEATTDATQMSAKAWKEAEKKAKKVLDEFKKGEKTADAFADLAKDNSKDGNASDGGLYENITPNKMVPTFNAWCFDASRKAGDTAIVKTQFGYHVMYFEGKGDMPVWKYTAQQALASDDGETSKEKLEKSYEIKTNILGSCFFETDTDIDS